VVVTVSTKVDGTGGNASDEGEEGKDGGEGEHYDIMIKRVEVIKKVVGWWLEA
jgi:hypothetical protein